MMLEREITPHPEEQRSYAELRDEFRQTALVNLRGQFNSHHELGWSMIGDPARSRARYSPEEWVKEMLLRLDEPVTQEFGLDDIPFTVSVKLEQQAQAAMLHESATWSDEVSGVVDHDAPACDLAAMSDDQVCDYIADAIERSRDAFD